MESKKKTKLQIIVILLLVVFAILFVWRKSQSDKVNEEALIGELRSVRLAVALYQEANKAYPENLKVLTTDKFKTPSGEKPYLSIIKVNKKGEPVDAFGNPFSYDPATGRVWPSEKQYASW